MFYDTMQYKQFMKQVFGRQVSALDFSKLNKSYNNGSKLNKSLNESQSQKTSSKQIPKPIVQQKPKIQQKSQAMIPNKAISKINPKIQNSNKNNQKPYQNKLKSSINSLKINTQVMNQQPNHTQSNQQDIQSTKKIGSPVSGIKKESPSKRKYTSPSNKNITSSKQIQQQPQQIEEGQKRNYLTQSLFDEQQLFIQSLQQQLQQANQIIEQYKLQLDLLKKQTQALEQQKSNHYHEMQSSRSRAASTYNNFGQNRGANILQQQQINKLRDQLQQYKKVFIQKQQIIAQKDHTINNLQASLQETTVQLQQKLIEKELAYNELHDQYIYATQEENYLKIQNEQLKSKLTKKQEDNNVLQLMIDQLKGSVESLSQMIKNNNNNNQFNNKINQLNKKLSQKDNQLKQLSQQLQLQRQLKTQLQIKTVDLQTNVQTLNTTIINLNKQVQQVKSKSNKAQQHIKKYQDLKDKAQQQMTRAIEKFKIIEKEKYLLNQQISNMTLKQLSVQKLVQEKVVSYKQQLDQLVLTYEQSQNKIAQLKFAVQSYQSTLQSQQSNHQQQVSQLTKKLQNFNKKQYLLRQSLDLLQDQTTKIKNYVQEKQVRLKEYEELVYLKDQEITEKNDKINFIQRKLRMLQNTIEDLKIHNKTLQAMANQSINGGYHGRDQRNNNARDGQQLQNRIFIISQANLQLIQKQKVQSQELDQKQKTIHQLQKVTLTIQPLKRQIKALQQKIIKIQKQNIQLKEEIKHKIRQNSQYRKKMDQVNSQLEHEYKQIVKLQQTVRLLEDEKIMIYAQYQEKELEVVYLQEKEEIMKSNVKTVERQINQRDNELMFVRRQLQELEKAYNELNKQYTQMSKKSNVFDSQGIQNKKQPLSSSRFTKQKQPISAVKQAPIKQSNISAIRSPNMSAIKQVSQLQLYSSRTNNRTKQQQQIYRLTQQLQGYKQRQQSYMCNVLDLQQQLQKVKKQKLSLSTSINEQKNSIRKSQQSLHSLNQYDKKDLKAACNQLQRLIQQRIKNRQTDNLIQTLISNSQLICGSQSRLTNEQGIMIVNQRNNLQQKSRILSRQLQKIKATVLKKNQLSRQNKAQITQLLKPCQNITKELIKIIQNYANQNQQILVQQ